jgi:hypothetical protein
VPRRLATASTEQATEDVGERFDPLTVLSFACCQTDPTRVHKPLVTDSASRERPALVALKAVHTLIWFSVEASMMFVLYKGWRGRSDRAAGIAAAIVAGETTVFLANGARCPLTGLAERLGAESGSVTDLYLPKWLAHNLPAIHVPLVLLAVYLHTRNIRRRGALAPSVSLG